MDIQDMRIFMRVAALQNLSAVGTEMALTPGTISKRIQALEGHLGVRLFDRTTRSTRITEEGRTFLTHVERILEEIDVARAALGEAASRPQGRIKVSAPASLSQRYITPAVCAFMHKYRDVDVSIDLTDKLVNLHEDGYDLAIRSGALTDSTMIAKRLAADRCVIVASPDYIAAQGMPVTPADLAGHSCLVLGENWQWDFEKDGRASAVRVSGRLRSDSCCLLQQAAIGGHGIIRCTQSRVFDELASGALVEVLTDYAAPGTYAIWGVYPSAKHVLPKLRVFLDFLTDWLRDSPPALRPGIAAAADAELPSNLQAGRQQSGQPAAHGL